MMKMWKTIGYFVCFVCMWGLFLAGGCKEAGCKADTDCINNQYCSPDVGACVDPCKVDDDCVSPARCQASVGRCVEAGSCTANASKRCVDSKVFQFDSCGKQGEEIEDCGTRTCRQGRCQTPTATCGNGVCDVGREDCTLCPKDCACQSGERCEDGACKSSNTCGNGTCDKGLEDCASCSADCACATGQLCKDSQCIAQPSCGNGACEKESGEHCLSCPGDCPCPTSQQCNAATTSCVEACGDGKCAPGRGETCATCPQDCACSPQQRCAQGVCSLGCGNGRCDTSYGETCSTCARDCPCGTNQACANGGCGKQCGDSKCDAATGENCSTCPNDCPCGANKSCNTGKCDDQCGNGICDTSAGETCSTCPKDCACAANTSCIGGRCIAACGDGKCDDTKGETCATCPKDCGCPGTQVCRSGKCAKDACGTCPGSTICKDGACVCNHQCDPIGRATCTGTDQLERCTLDAQGCRVWKVSKCPAGNNCKNGSCCASGCKSGQECGTNACGGSCGTCNQRASCQNDRCVCNHECTTASLTQCLSKTNYKVCQQDGRGCRYWSSSLICPGGGTCQNNVCCRRQCSNRECGSDACGGNCGTCTFRCANNLCRRKMIVATLFLPCGLCSDSIPFYKDPDPFVQLTLSNGQAYQSKNQDDICGKTITFKWEVTDIDPNLLKSAKLEVYDYDDLDSHDLCVGWTGDLSPPGKRVLKHNGATITFDILQ